MEQLVTAVQAVLWVVPADLPEAEALADTVALLRSLDQLNGALLTRLADVDLRRLHTLDGAPSTRTWVTAQPTSVPAAQVTLARRMSRFPTLSAALADRQVSVDAATRIGATLAKLSAHLDRPDGLIDGQPGEQSVTTVVTDNVRILLCQAWAGLADDDPRLTEIINELTEISHRPATQLARIEAALVVLARDLPATELPSALRRLLDALLPNELEKRAARGQDNARVVLSRKPDGSGWLVSRGELDLECGELLHTVLTAMNAVDPDNPADTAAWAALRDDGWHDDDPLPTEPYGPDLAGPESPDPDLPADEPPATCGRSGPRSRGQQGHDALKAALRLLVDSGLLGTRDKIAPHLLVTVGIDTLHAAPGALPATGSSGASLPLSLVRQWWCQSTITRILFGLGRRAIETSHPDRTLKNHERRIKHAETGGHCQGAGCTRGPGCRLIPHHVTAYARCGTTSLTDTVLLWESTHAQLHQGKTIRLKDGRFLNQDGWVL